MLKILVVDDEKSSRDVIVKLINWDEFDIGWVGEAEDGLQALSVAAVERPDILLTDIKMSKMDGISLAEKARELLPNCKIIFLTGYSDKEYLKAAIRYKAVSYIEKPIDLTEVSSVLKTVVADLLLEKEQHQKLLIDELSALSIDLINAKPDWGSIKTRINTMSVDFKDIGFYITAVLNFQILDLEWQENHDMVRNECLDKLNSYIDCFKGRYIMGFKGSDHILIHFSVLDKEYENVLNTLQDYLDEIHSLSSFPVLSISLGSLEAGLHGISVSYRSAIMALQQRFFRGIGKILTYKGTTSSPFVFDEAWLKQISIALDKNSQNETVIIVKRLTNEIRKNENTQPDYIRNIYFRIVMLLSIHAKDHNIQLLNDECSFILDSIANSITLEDIENETLSLVHSVFRYMKPTSDTDDLITKITEYIHNNYSNSGLSVNAIAQDVFLTASYLCVFFKKGTGKTINQYITEYRIEKAKELLKNPAVKLLNVSERVGYSDAKYFTRVFEKTTGLKPRKYRELHYEA